MQTAEVAEIQLTISRWDLGTAISVSSGSETSPRAIINDVARGTKSYRVILDCHFPDTRRKSRKERFSVFPGEALLRATAIGSDALVIR